MKKAVNLRLHIRLEGDDEPAHDFAGEGVSLITQALALGAAALEEQRRGASLAPRAIVVEGVTAVEGSFSDEEV